MGTHSTFIGRINAKSYVLFGLVCFIAISLPVLSHNLPSVWTIPKYGEAINHHLIYQPVTLLLIVVLLLVLKYYKKDVFQEYFKWGKDASEILPEPYVGIRPKPGETWRKAGLEWTLIISFVTGVITFFQIYSKADVSFGSIGNFPFVLIFALVNSFVEECITRFGVIVALKGALRDRAIAVVSGVLFGSIHYFGSPGGIIGVLVAGFLGWFLAKSILETKGIFWAWFIHFIQDVIIMTILFGIK